MTSIDPVRPIRTYGNWRRPQSRGLMGLGSVGTGIMIGGLALVIFTAMFAGLLRAIIVGALVGLLLLAIMSKDKHGRNALTRGGARASWWWARRQGSHLYRSGPLGRTAWGTYQLPGLAAPLRLTEQEDAYGQKFAMLYCPQTTTYTVVIAAEPEGAALVDVEEVDNRVADWGAWLASLGDEPGVQAASVTVETAPDSGARLRREVTGRMDPNAPEFAREVLAETMETYPAGSSTVKAYLTISFSALSRIDGRKRSDEEMGRDLAARLPALTSRLASTGAGAARAMTAQRLCEVIRVAYDPSAGPIIEAEYAEGRTVDLKWPDCGPSAAQAFWDGYRHDGAYSITWAMSEAPRGHVQSSVLDRLLQPHPEIVRKRVTLLYRPIDSARAAGLVESDQRAAEFRVTASTKPTAREQLALRHAASTAAEEASGAGLVNFAMLVTATVNNPAHAPHARATVDSLSATARLKLRLVNGAQDSAFAACLPLGLILPRHLKVPAEWQEKL
ncbi:hypothetical protein GCM10011584_34110 [Nocardioides phosphati]|uniref:PrgI family protein n=1 Tax=Nocardioides phosphati TaxID=1867775 RepID=A0ABQ2NDQ1_9ACTN|nr:SCO6880 family protein [Nocardioides phosphati]GGO94034.1 hypothetical protein GCM10011584_34110 [Nocardioides phosphati]